MKNFIFSQEKVFKELKSRKLKTVEELDQALQFQEAALKKQSKQKAKLANLNESLPKGSLYNGTSITLVYDRIHLAKVELSMINRQLDGYERKVSLLEAELKSVDRDLLLMEKKQKKEFKSWQKTTVKREEEIGMDLKSVQLA